MIRVVGATGQLGGRIVQRLVEGGQEVGALVRPSTDATALVEKGVQVARGDLVRPRACLLQLDGVDTVVTTAAANDAAVDADGNRHLIEAAQQAGVQRFVYVSAAGIGAEMARSGSMAGEWQTDQLLRSTSLRFVLVRPDMFQGTWLGLPLFDAQAGTAMVAGRGQTRHRYVAVDDVAALCAHLAVADGRAAGGGVRRAGGVDADAGRRRLGGCDGHNVHRPAHVAGRARGWPPQPGADPTGDGSGHGLAAVLRPACQHLGRRTTARGGRRPRPASEFITASVTAAV